MFVPAVPLALLLAVRGIERWRSDEPRSERAGDLLAWRR
jgi:hypothetical protein